MLISVIDCKSLMSYKVCLCSFTCVTSLICVMFCASRLHLIEIGGITVCFLQVPEGMAVLLLDLAVGAAQGAPVQWIFSCLGQAAILTFSTTAATQSVFFSHLKLNFFEWFVFHAFWGFVMST